jgi:hypothetical protein
MIILKCLELPLFITKSKSQINFCKCALWLRHNLMLKAKPRSDNGTEFINTVVLNYCAQKGIEPQHSAPYNPQSNRSAESLNRVPWQKATSMLRTSGIKYSMWSEAVMTANYVRNRSPHSNTPDNATPYGLWRNIKPSIGQLKLFGCDAYVVVPTHIRDKFSPKADLGTFVGWDQYSGPYRIYYSNTNTEVFRDVIFNELHFLQSSIKELSLLQDLIDNFIANQAANQKANKNREDEETSDDTIPTQPLITNI